MEQPTQDGLAGKVAAAQQHSETLLNLLREQLNTYITEHHPAPAAIVGALLGLAANVILQSAPDDAEAMRFATVTGANFVTLMAQMLEGRAHENTDQA